MDISQRQEQFSIAYVRAVASVAGYSTYEPTVDDDSIDIGFCQKGGNGTYRSPRLEAQLKCAYDVSSDEEYMKYSLKLKNFEDLSAENVLVPRILILVHIPSSINDWLIHTEEDMKLQYNAYWLSLRGQTTENTTGITANFPKTNRFTIDALNSIMQRISQGGLP